MDHDLKMYVAANLRAARKRAGLTQEELAHRIGRTAESLSNVERGLALPALDTLIALSNTLGMAVQDFLPDPEFVGRDPQSLKLEAELLSISRTLSAPHLSIAVEQILVLANHLNVSDPIRK